MRRNRLSRRSIDGLRTEKHHLYVLLMVRSRRAPATSVRRIFDLQCERERGHVRRARRGGAKSGTCDPYPRLQMSSTTYLGDDVADAVFFPLYQLEWGKAVAPKRSRMATSAPRCRRWRNRRFSTTADAVCRLPLGWFPYYRDTRPNSVDSPFMVAIAIRGSANGCRTTHPDLAWLMEASTLEHQSAAAGGQQPHRVRLHPQHRNLTKTSLYERVPGHGAKVKSMGLSLSSALCARNIATPPTVSQLPVQWVATSVYGYDFRWSCRHIHSANLRRNDIRIGSYISPPTSSAARPRTTTPIRIR